MLDRPTWLFLENLLCFDGPIRFSEKFARKKDECRMMPPNPAARKWAPSPWMTRRESLTPLVCGCHFWPQSQTTRACGPAAVDGKQFRRCSAQSPLPMPAPVAAVQNGASCTDDVQVRSSPGQRIQSECCSACLLTQCLAIIGRVQVVQRASDGKRR